MNAWIVRAGVNGDRDDWALSEGLAGGGFIEIPDLTSATTRDQVQFVVAAQMPGAKPMKVANFVGQMWALRDRIKPGDVIVLPMKTTKQIAVGVCTGGYEYRAGDVADRHHCIRVDWKRTDVPRSAIKDDLLNTLNGAMTIFGASKNNAAARLQAVMETGVDPGAGAATDPTTKPKPVVTDDDPTMEDPAVDPVPAVTVETIRDRVRTHLIENFGTHKLTGLVADILRAQGYVCDVSPAGPDFGVDILAGRGPLGLDSPTLVVEVKSEHGQIGVPVLNQLQGAVKNNNADQALLVAWGGLNKQAETLRMSQRLKVRVWTAEDVMDQLFETYDRLPDATRAAIPLKRAWVLLEETG